jgi:hypothetical protein
VPRNINSTREIIMKKLILTSVLLLTPVLATAGCIGAIVNGRCSGTEVNGVEGSGSAQGNANSQRYEGSAGTQYQYNLNNPGDQRNYQHDLDAQRRDQMSADPRRQTDRSVGQIGGGIDR